MSALHLQPNHQATQERELSSCRALNHSSPKEATIVHHQPPTLATMVDYGTRLAEAMKHAQSSPTALSKALGVSYQAVKKVLDGKSLALNAENHMRAARFLGVNSYWLATGEESLSLKSPAAAPIPISSYKATENDNTASSYNWPFKSLSAQQVRELSDFRRGLAEGYLKRLIDEEASIQSNGTNHNKS